MFRSNSTSDLSKIRQRVSFDPMGGLAPVLEIRDRIGHRPIALARLLGRHAQRRRRGRLGKTLGFLGPELGAFEMRMLSMTSDERKYVILQLARSRRSHV